MKASETKLRELLEGSKQFQIPLFQRPYSWSKKEWNALWKDLMEVYNEREEYHFLGPIVTQAVPGTPDGISPFLLIDGQQRLTTLSILLAALRDYLKEHNSESAAELQELYLINRFKKGDARYKILPTQADQEVYQQVVQEQMNECTNIIYEAYKFFVNQLKNGNLEEQALQYVESYFVRRLFAGLTTRWMDKIFNNLYQDVEKRLQEQNSSNFVSGLREHLRNLPSSSKAQVWPDDNLFRQSIIENPVSGSRVRLLLESLEEPLTKFQVKTDNLTLEHIMPQKLTDEWRTLLGTDAEEVQKRWLHTLGNLTLTPYNSEMSNHPFRDKLPFLQNSALTLDNQYFKNVHRWNAEEIQRRAEYLADIAVKVCPR